MLDLYRVSTNNAKKRPVSADPKAGVIAPSGKVLFTNALPTAPASSGGSAGAPTGTRSEDAPAFALSSGTHAHTLTDGAPVPGVPTTTTAAASSSTMYTSPSTTAAAAATRSERSASSHRRADEEEEKAAAAHWSPQGHVTRRHAEGAFGLDQAVQRSIGALSKSLEMRSRLFRSILLCGEGDRAAVCPGLADLIEARLFGNMPSGIDTVSVVNGQVWREAEGRDPLTDENEAEWAHRRTQALLHPDYLAWRGARVITEVALCVCVCVWCGLLPVCRLCVCMYVGLLLFCLFACV
jgi:hypothetical protein